MLFLVTYNYFYKYAVNKFAPITGSELFACSWLRIIKSSVSCLIEIIITHKNIVYNNLGLGMRKERINNTFYYESNPLCGPKRALSL